MTNIAEIYAYVASCGRPCQLPEPWSALSPPASFIHPPLDAAGLLDQLQSRFCDAELREAGLVATDPGGMTVLRPPWGDPKAVLFVARQAAEAAPFALVSDELDERHWPRPAQFGDYQAPTLAEKFNNCWFIVPTMADAAVIWSLGLPAAPAHGLADLKRARLAQFREAMELERRHEEDEHQADEPDWSRQALERKLPTDAEQETRSLVLVPWSPARLAAADAPQIETAGRHLQKLLRRGRLPLPIYIWSLSEKQLDALRFDASHFEPEDVRRAALET